MLKEYNRIRYRQQAAFFEGEGGKPLNHGEEADFLVYFTR